MEKSIPILKIKSETDLICLYTPSYSYSDGYVAFHIACEEKENIIYYISWRKFSLFNDGNSVFVV